MIIIIDYINIIIDNCEIIIKKIMMCSSKFEKRIFSIIILIIIINKK